MTDELITWGQRWGFNLDAILELQKMLYGQVTYCTPHELQAQTESGVQSRCRLDLARRGALVWRNNVGALQDANGRWLRYGLANDSAAVNKQIKSSDLVGIWPTGQFLARECKPPYWVYSGTEREKAQLRYLRLIASMGGDAAFHNGVDCPVNSL